MLVSPASTRSAVISPPNKASVIVTVLIDTVPVLVTVKVYVTSLPTTKHASPFAIAADLTMFKPLVGVQNVNSVLFSSITYVSFASMLVVPSGSNPLTVTMFVIIPVSTSSCVTV